MIRRRTKADGLPFRVYERYGTHLYSIGYKLTNGTWAFKYRCDVNNKNEISQLKHKAIQEANQLQYSQPIGGTISLIEAYFEWQESLPHTDLNRRADSTIKENKREAENLKKAFGHIDPSEINKTHGYAYLDACVQANRPQKGNKEIALLQVILEYAVRTGVIAQNPLAGIRKNKTLVKKRYVSNDEIALALKVGREKGGTRLIVALALHTAWLCVRRSVEVRGITRDAITDSGIVWKDGKNKEKPPVLIEWSSELKQTIQEVLAIKRNHVAGSMYLFGNMRGQKYTKGGWKAVLDDLMQSCVIEAAKINMEFKPFSLQDCRPKGVSDKLESGQTDVIDATGHTSERMVRQVYDRREMKKSKPVK